MYPLLFGLKRGRVGLEVHSELFGSIIAWEIELLEAGTSRIYKRVTMFDSLNDSKPCAWTSE